MGHDPFILLRGRRLRLTRLACQLFLVAFCACSDLAQQLQSPTPSAAPVSASESAAISLSQVSLSVIELEQDDIIELTVGDTEQLSLKIEVSNGGHFSHVTKTFDSAYDQLDATVLWFANDAQTVTVNASGVITGVSAGTTTVKATLINKSVALTVVVHDSTSSSSDTGSTSASTSMTSTSTDTPQANSNSGSVVLPQSSTSSDSSTSTSVAHGHSPRPPPPRPHGATTATSTETDASTFTATATSTATVTSTFTATTTATETTTVSATDTTTDTDISTPIMTTEEPNSYWDRFLGYDDDIEVEFGDNGGYNDHLLPAIVHGLPQIGGTHVVSFGSGGSITIVLHGFDIVNGEGPDFTIFENPILSGTDGNFQERAEVEVSSDGENFIAFACDAFDEAGIYAGCAGVTPVNATADALDPEASGGDTFDLADVELTEARVIRITDMETCVSGDESYEVFIAGIPLCAESGKEGFDLDALVILNGVNEE